jgi:hypothetical protein
MTKITIQKYTSIVDEKELALISCKDKTKILPIYLELIQFQINHSYILQELPYFYIRSLYEWINSSIIYVEYCLTIGISRSCIRLLEIKEQIIEWFNKIIEITSGDYDILCEIYDLLTKIKEMLENLHPCLVTIPNTRNNIHLGIL